MLYYNGAGVDITFMGAGEMDPHGPRQRHAARHLLPRRGWWFIDITQNARHVVFCSSFTAKGLEIACEQGALHIRREGRGTQMSSPGLIRFLTTASWSAPKDKP